jgi:hypothetical protein
MLEQLMGERDRLCSLQVRVPGGDGLDMTFALLEQRRLQADDEVRDDTRLVA